MIERDLPVSIGVDVCWHGGRLVVARQSGPALVVEAFSDPHAVPETIRSLPGGDNAAARVCSSGNALWLAFRDAHDHGHLVRVDDGTSWMLGPVFGQRPFAFGGGQLTWLAGPTTARTIVLGDAVGTARSIQFPDSVASGLSHIDDSGAVVTWEAMRQVAPWAAGFARSGRFLIGEDFDNRGLRGAVDGHAGRLVLWTDDAMHDPRIEEKDARCAVVAWASGNRPARLAIVTAADLVPEQEERQSPVPTPTPEPAMSIPDRSAEAATFLASRLRHVPGDPAATSAATFAAVNALCLQFRKTDPRWFLLVKEPGQNNVRLRGVDVLLYQLSATEAQVVDVVADGDGHDGPPRPSWEPKDIRPVAQAREPFTGSSDVQPQTHTYDGGDNDTGICDICGKPKSDPIHHAAPGGLELLVAAAVAAAVAPLKLELAALKERTAALEAAAAQPAPPLPQRIALKTAHGRYITAEQDGRITGTRDSAAAWETFRVEPQ